MDLFYRNRKTHNASINSNYRQTTLSSHQSTYKSKEINYARYIGSSSLSRQTLNSNQQLPKPPAMQQKVKNTSANLAKGMNAHFLYLRKENHLNTCYNLRKNKLKEMTRINKQLYQKLNTQKSLYSNSDMNKSYQSIKQIKDRLSQSKLSQRSSLSRQSSQKSLKGTKSMKGIQKRKDMPLQVKAMNINQVNQKEIDRFKSLFQKDTISKTKQTIESSEDIVRYNSYQRKDPYLRFIPFQQMSSCPEICRGRTFAQNSRRPEGKSNDKCKKNKVNQNDIYCR